MGNSTSAPGSPEVQRQKSLASTNFNKSLVNGAILSRRSAPKITKLEARGEVTKASEFLNDELVRERQKSVVSSQESERSTRGDASMESTTSVSSISSSSSTSMVDVDDDNIFQHIEEIDKDIEFEHIEGIGLGGGGDFRGKRGDEKIPVVIKWIQSGQEREVHIIGDFTNWKKKLKLAKHDTEYSITLNLPPGLYKIQFIINNREMKISNHLPMATDNEGNIVNWFEVYEHSAPMQLENKNQTSESIIEAGSAENKRLFKKTMSSDNPILSPSHSGSFVPSVSGRTTPFSERGSPQSLSRVFPYNTNERHVSNQSTISGYSVNNDSSSVNSVSTYQYHRVEKPAVHYTQELPEIYYKESLSYPFPEVGEMSSSQYYKQVDFEDFLVEKLDLTAPPELPLYLSSLLINDNQHSKNNKLNDLNVDKYTGVNYSGLDNVPSHVILKHLITTNIKSNVMMVTVINRYEGKYVYQALYSPVDI